MRRVSDIIRTFRDKLKAFGAYLLEENWRLRRILYLLEHAYCLLTCQGEIVSETTTVTTAIGRIRRQDSMAKKTIVTNNGASTAIIYEDDQIVGLVDPGEELRLPLQGRLTLTAKTASGSTSVTVATLRRCLCGDEPYMEGDFTPIGGNLI